MSPSPPIRVQVARSLESFRALEPLWNALAARGAVGTPYQSFVWLEHWLRHRAGVMEPFVLVLQNGETIAPFGRVRQAGVRVLRLLGAPDSDYTGLVTVHEPSHAWNAVAQALQASGTAFDLVHLHSVRDREPISIALARHFGRTGWVRVYETCPWIRVDQPWEAFRAGRSKALRSELKRWERRVSEAGLPQVERVRPPIGGPLIAELADVERQSWKWEQGNATFRPGRYRDFICAMLGDPRTDAELWLLRVGGALAAFAVVLIAQNRWCFYLTSYRKDAANSGAFLLARIVEAACDSGCRTIDLLRGDHGYKRVWTDQADAVYEVAWPCTALGSAAALAYAARWRAARSARLQRFRARLQGIGDRRVHQSV